MNLDRLGQPLDKSRIKSRQGRGSGSLSYLETHDVIRTANDIFGFGKWGHEVAELRLLPGVAVTNRDNKPGVHVGYVCVVRLTVEGCVPVSGVGYGDAVEYTAAAPVTAHELAAKEAESDALKRALKNYGDQFGLALYDKQAATSGHVADSAPRAGKTGKSIEKPEGWPSKAEADALLELVAKKGGDVEATKTAMGKAKNRPETFVAWFRETREFFEGQTDSYANKIPKGAKAAA